MGWWKVQGSDDVVGDEVFSFVRAATRAVNEQYRQALGRSPSRSEWERLLCDAIQPIDDLESDSTEPLVAETARPTAVRILLGGDSE